jgi:NAD(P)-dependent dehydrogenase (short-subunit alcohol dehydrogenase family)
LELARLGAEVVIVSRNDEKCKQVVETIRKETENPQVNYLQADLSSLDEIRDIAQEFHHSYPHLDVLVNNVGVMNLRRRETVDGFERTFATNHLGPFLLTNLLLDMLKANDSARVVNVSSNSHYGSPLNFDDLQMVRRYRGTRAYGLSKMANVLFTYALSRRLAGTGVTANALHPGFVRTDIGKDNGFLVSIFQPLVMLRAIPVEEGAETSIYLASSPEVEKVTGMFFTRKKPVDSDPFSYDVGAQERLWEISVEMVGL